MKSLITVLTLLFPARRSVDGIMAGFHKQITQLDNLTFAAAAKGAKLSDKASAMRLKAAAIDAKADAVSREASKASAVSERLKDFVA